MITLRKKLMQKRNGEKGFSLLEMIVAIGIFMTAFTIILGALTSVNTAARKTRSARIVNDNLSAAIDSMARSMRTGSKFHCGCDFSNNAVTATPLDCRMTNNTGTPGGDTCIAFEGQGGNSSDDTDQIAYRLTNGSIERSLASGNAGTFAPLTAPELSLSNLRFYLDGTASGGANNNQPVITIVIAGSASTTARTATYFNVQTTVSAYTPNL